MTRPCRHRWIRPAAQDDWFRCEDTCRRLVHRKELK